MKVNQQKFLALLVAAVVAMPIAVNAAHEFLFATNGQAKAVIVVQDGATNGLRTAANLLSDTLGRMTGARFMVTDRPVSGFNTILVGAPYKATRPQELCIRVKNRKTLEVTGDGPRGAMHAACELLEHFGVVFSAHDYTYAPSVKGLALPEGFERIDAPHMLWREACAQLQRHHFDYMLRLRLDPNERDSRWRPLFGSPYRPDIRQMVCTAWVSRKKYAKDHPEWYSYNRHTGKRNLHWVCVSNEEMLTKLCEEIDAYLAKQPGRYELSLGIDDSYTYCECEKCLALVDRYIDKNGMRHPALQCAVLANEVGKRLGKKYPKVRFNFLGYGGFHDTIPSGTDFAFEPNVGAGVAELWRNHGLAADLNERSDALLGAISRLAAKENGTYIWDYLANFEDYLIPFPNHYILGQTMKYYKRVGVKGLYTQMQWTRIGDFSEMKMWLYAKLLWNPDEDVNKLIEKYVKATYGKGAPHVMEYIRLLEHARLRQRWTWYGCYVGDTSHYLTAYDCVKMFRAMEQAVRVTRGDINRHVMARRASIAVWQMAMGRYNDMIVPAQHLKYKLPSRNEIYDGWNATLQSEFFRQADGEIGEGRMFHQVKARFKKSFANPPAPTEYPRRSTIIHIGAKDLTGGKRMTKERDADGTEYAQFKVKLGEEVDNVWMNPGFAEIGYTLPAEDAGYWYVFATVRIDTSVECNPAAAYMGIYQPWFMNGVEVKGGQEVANQAIQARKGDLEWKTICLGKRRLYPRSRIWLMPGVLHHSAFCDVKEITLVAPELIEKTVIQQPK